MNIYFLNSICKVQLWQKIWSSYKKKIHQPAKNTNRQFQSLVDIWHSCVLPYSPHVWVQPAFLLPPQPGQDESLSQGSVSHASFLLCSLHGPVQVLPGTTGKAVECLLIGWGKITVQFKMFIWDYWWEVFSNVDKITKEVRLLMGVKWWKDGYRLWR